MPYYNVDGRDLYYEISEKEVIGSKRFPVVLIHGYLGDSQAHFGKQFKSNILTDYNFIAPDLRGFGKSQLDQYKKWGEPHTSEQLLLDIHILIKELKVENLIIGGYSVGAALALEYAKKHPNTVKGIILISPRPFVNEKGKSMPFLSKERRSSANFLMRTSSNLTWGLLKRFTKRSSSKWIKKKLKNQSLVEEFKLLDNIPSVLIYANRDSVTPQIAFDVLKDNIKNLQIMEFDGDHGILHEKPDLFNQKLKEFLDSVILSKT